MEENRRKFIRKMIKLTFQEIRLHGGIVYDGAIQPDFPTVVTQYGAKVKPRLTVAEVMEVLPEFEKQLKSKTYKNKIKLPEGGL
jgi:hypothetical protein